MNVMSLLCHLHENPVDESSVGADAVVMLTNDRSDGELIAVRDDVETRSQETDIDEQFSPMKDSYEAPQIIHSPLEIEAPHDIHSSLDLEGSSSFVTEDELADVSPVYGEYVGDIRLAVGASPSNILKEEDEEEAVAKNDVLDEVTTSNIHCDNFSNTDVELVITEHKNAVRTFSEPITDDSSETIERVESESERRERFEQVLSTEDDTPVCEKRSFEVDIIEPHEQINTKYSEEVTQIIIDRVTQDSFPIADIANSHSDFGFDDLSRLNRESADHIDFGCEHATVTEQSDNTWKPAKQPLTVMTEADVEAQKAEFILMRQASEDSLIKMDSDSEHEISIAQQPLQSMQESKECEIDIPVTFDNKTVGDVDDLLAMDDNFLTSTSSETSAEPTLLAATYDVDTGTVSKVIATYDISPDSIEKNIPCERLTRVLVSSPDDEVFENENDLLVNEPQSPHSAMDLDKPLAQHTGIEQDEQPSQHSGINLDEPRTQHSGNNQDEPQPQHSNIDLDKPQYQHSGIDPDESQTQYTGIDLDEPQSQHFDIDLDEPQSQHFAPQDRPVLEAHSQEQCILEVNVSKQLAFKTDTQEQYLLEADTYTGLNLKAEKYEQPNVHKTEIQQQDHETDIQQDQETEIQQQFHETEIQQYRETEIQQDRETEIQQDRETEIQQQDHETETQQAHETEICDPAVETDVSKPDYEIDSDRQFTIHDTYENILNLEVDEQEQHLAYDATDIYEQLTCEDNTQKQPILSNTYEQPDLRTDEQQQQSDLEADVRKCPTQSIDEQTSSFDCSSPISSSETSDLRGPISPFDLMTYDLSMQAVSEETIDISSHTGLDQPGTTEDLIISYLHTNGPTEVDYRPEYDNADEAHNEPLQNTGGNSIISSIENLTEEQHENTVENEQELLHNVNYDYLPHQEVLEEYQELIEEQQELSEEQLELLVEQQQALSEVQQELPAESQELLTEQSLSDEHQELLAESQELLVEQSLSDEQQELPAESQELLVEQSLSDEQQELPAESQELLVEQSLSEVQHELPAESQELLVEQSLSDEQHELPAESQKLLVEQSLSDEQHELPAESQKLLVEQSLSDEQHELPAESQKLLVEQSLSDEQHELSAESQELLLDQQKTPEVQQELPAEQQILLLTQALSDEQLELSEKQRELIVEQQTSPEVQRVLYAEQQESSKEHQEIIEAHHELSKERKELSKEQQELLDKQQEFSEKQQELSKDLLEEHQELIEVQQKLSNEQQKLFKEQTLFAEPREEHEVDILASDSMKTLIDDKEEKFQSEVDCRIEHSPDNYEDDEASADRQQSLEHLQSENYFIQPQSPKQLRYECDESDLFNQQLDENATEDASMDLQFLNNTNNMAQKEDENNFFLNNCKEHKNLEALDSICDEERFRNKNQENFPENMEEFTCENNTNEVNVTIINEKDDNVAVLVDTDNEDEPPLPPAPQVSTDSSELFPHGLPTSDTLKDFDLLKDVMEAADKAKPAEELIDVLNDTDDKTLKNQEKFAAQIFEPQQKYIADLQELSFEPYSGNATELQEHSTGLLINFDDCNTAENNKPLEKSNLPYQHGSAFISLTDTRCDSEDFELAELANNTNETFPNDQFLSMTNNNELQRPVSPVPSDTEHEKSLDDSELAKNESLQKQKDVDEETLQSTAAELVDNVVHDACQFVKDSDSLNVESGNNMENNEALIENLESISNDNELERQSLSFNDNVHDTSEAERQPTCVDSDEDSEVEDKQNNGNKETLSPSLVDKKHFLAISLGVQELPAEPKEPQAEAQIPDAPRHQASYKVHKKDWSFDLQSEIVFKSQRSNGTPTEAVMSFSEMMMALHEDDKSTDDANEDAMGHSIASGLSIDDFGDSSSVDSFATVVAAKHEEEGEDEDDRMAELASLSSSITSELINLRDIKSEEANDDTDSLEPDDSSTTSSEQFDIIDSFERETAELSQKLQQATQLVTQQQSATDFDDLLMAFEPTILTTIREEEESSKEKTTSSSSSKLDITAISDSDSRGITSSPDLPTESPGMFIGRFFGKSSERDDISVSSSLLEFERLEKEVDLGSVDSLNVNIADSSTRGGGTRDVKIKDTDDSNSVSSSLAEFELLEREVTERRLLPGIKSESSSMTSLVEFERLERIVVSDIDSDDVDVKVVTTASSSSSLAEFERLEQEIVLDQELENEALKVATMLASGKLVGSSQTAIVETLMAGAKLSDKKVIAETETMQAKPSCIEPKSTSIEGASATAIFQMMHEASASAEAFMSEMTKTQNITTSYTQVNNFQETIKTSSAFSTVQNANISLYSGQTIFASDSNDPLDNDSLNSDSLMQLSIDSITEQELFTAVAMSSTSAAIHEMEQYSLMTESTDSLEMSSSSLNTSVIILSANRQHSDIVSYTHVAQNERSAQVQTTKIRNSLLEDTMISSINDNLMDRSVDSLEMETMEHISMQQSFDCDSLQGEFIAVEVANDDTPTEAGRSSVEVMEVSLESGAWSGSTMRSSDFTESGGSPDFMQVSMYSRSSDKDIADEELSDDTTISQLQTPTREHITDHPSRLSQLMISTVPTETAAHQEMHERIVSSHKLQQEALTFIRDTQERRGYHMSESDVRTRGHEITAYEPGVGLLAFQVHSATDHPEARPTATSVKVLEHLSEIVLPSCIAVDPLTVHSETCYCGPSTRASPPRGCTPPRFSTPPGSMTPVKGM